MPVIVRGGISRRELLATGALMLTGAARANSVASPPRVAALGWSCAQALLALGLTPLVVPEIERYRRLVVEPAIPTEVSEIGLRSEPNFELLRQLTPDLIVIDPGLASARARLERIAPVDVFTTLAPGRRPLATSQEAMRQLAARLGLDTACARYLARFETVMDDYRAEAAGYRGGPLYLVHEMFRNRALVFGGTSLYQDVLDRFGLRNAWTGPSSLYGHIVVGLEELAGVPKARLVLVNSRAADFERLLRTHPFLGSLPAVRASRITVLPDVHFSGGVPAAERFARLLADRLPKDDDGRG
ncbi:MAG: ABC transporter substrate-binding protein [Rhizobiales bacterium]|nr:ABC transporter substrate-binding protein [Hyphomicrobiales bacterium]